MLNILGQNFVCNFKWTKMSNAHLVAEMANIAEVTQFKETLENVSAFRLCYQVTPYGVAIVGDGSDERTP